MHREDIYHMLKQADAQEVNKLYRELDAIENKIQAVQSGGDVSVTVAHVDVEIPLNSSERAIIVQAALGQLLKVHAHRAAALARYGFELGPGSGEVCTPKPEAIEPT